MVSTTNKPKPTKDEAMYMVKEAERIVRYGEEIPCPRCGKPLIYTEIGTSFIITCSDEECISVSGRGI